MNLSVDPAVFERFPGYRAGIVVAEGVANGPSDDASDAALRAAEATLASLDHADSAASALEHPDSAASALEHPDSAASALEHPDPEASARDPRDSAASALEHPHLAAWREAFRAFGAKRQRCSAEALIARALEGSLPRISALVDRYNAVSVAHRVPVGGEDLDHVVPPVRLGFASGEEPFDDGGVRAGEVVWADAVGVTCRRWNWRQGVRTRLTDATTRAYFLFDALPPFSDAELAAAMEDLRASVLAAWPGAQLSSWVVSEPTAAG